jgi:hypothetical protein
MNVFGGGAKGASPYPQTPTPNPLQELGGELEGRAGDFYEKLPPALPSTTT